mmetsp:Transcript_29777/g.67442  ORF Transcript_29777/g.67442 Transcript_29777/m.67442 type:complete len:205 (+) Transcript_29777:290-904(+)
MMMLQLLQLWMRSLQAEVTSLAFGARLPICRSQRLAAAWGDCQRCLPLAAPTTAQRQHWRWSSPMPVGSGLEGQTKLPRYQVPLLRQEDRRLPVPSPPMARSPLSAFVPCSMPWRQRPHIHWRRRGPNCRLRRSWTWELAPVGQRLLPSSPAWPPEASASSSAQGDLHWGARPSSAATRRGGPPARGARPMAASSWSGPDLPLS